MIIAQEKRKTNIAEFILYMWQVEDLIRASNFDFGRIEETVISKFKVPAETLEEIRSWYSNLITLMAEEKIVQKGHMTFLNQLIREINDIHLRRENWISSFLISLIAKSTCLSSILLGINWHS